MALEPNVVFCTNVLGAYDRLDARFPELPAWAQVTTALLGVRTLLADAGLDRSHLGSPSWNPLARTIPRGSKVVIKPNWVNHYNASQESIDCLVTHPSVIEAILYYVAKANPASIVIGDAPVQGCDFASLIRLCRIDEMAERFTRHNVNVSIKDFRRTIRPNAWLGGHSEEECRAMSEFVLFDLGSDSSLEPVTTSSSEFRVTMYDPDELKRTHGPRRHQYLVARDVIEADVVFNMPKLKTHKKVGVTGAIKNVVGINGHKEYLPHHRKGGSRMGGDCYEGRSSVKSVVEDLLDATNRSRDPIVKPILANAVRAGVVLGRLTGLDSNYEGSWYGNDTAWRMSLDLQRILHYGRIDGTLADRVQRTVLSLTDAIVAGERDGPLAPSPKPLGMLTLSENIAAAEWVHALLMGLDPSLIAITREAFAPHRYSLAHGIAPTDITVRVDGQAVAISELAARHGSVFSLPAGWKGHCELSPVAAQL